MKDLKWKPILLGTLIDIGLTLGLGMAVLIAATLIFVSRGTSPDKLEESLSNDTPYLVMSLITGLLSTVVGGYVAANGSVGKSACFKNSLALGVLAIVLGVLFELTTTTENPLWYNIAAYLMVIPAALLGGYLRSRRAGAPSGSNSSQSSAPPIPLP